MTRLLWFALALLSLAVMVGLADRHAFDALFVQTPSDQGLINLNPD